MENIDFDLNKKHWIESSDKNFITMEHLFEANDYDWSLFMGHLVIEKLLKACFIIRKKQYPPLIHNLLRLAELSEIEMNEEQIEFFSTVTTFNLNARYDDYKENFYKLCTKEFTVTWLNKIKEYRQWIKTQHII
ncbi:MAG: HEPN domain-containing protein [Ignavibacteriae bacterium]|nr:HEPN domain-containing protein [Ignavibacteriota bacterium]